MPRRLVGFSATAHRRRTEHLGHDNRFGASSALGGTHAPTTSDLSELVHQDDGASDGEKILSTEGE